MLETVHYKRLSGLFIACGYICCFVTVKEMYHIGVRYVHTDGLILSGYN